MSESFSMMARLRSFSAAGNGLRVLLQEEHNARVHLLATALVVMAAFVLGANRNDWVVLIIVITLVWVSEAINTAIENLSDKLSPEYDPLIAKAKDVACLAVVISSLCALICGLLVFVPLLTGW